MSRRVLPTILVAACLLTGAAPASSREAAVSTTVNGTRFVTAPGALVSEPPRLDARAWVVADLDTGRLLGVRRPDRRLPMASTIKLLTALTAARIVPEYPTHRVTWREAHPEHCSCAGLKVGRRYSREALLAGMLLPSGNDAAEALAGSAPLGRAFFLKTMNRIASELRATGTNATTPSGLTTPGAYSTARDLLLFLRAAQGDPVVAPILDLATYPFGPLHGKRHTVFRSTDYVNKYVARYPGLQGKSGFTTPAKNTLVVNTPIRGHRIGVAILGAKSGTTTRSARRLTMWAVRNFDALGEVDQLP